MRSQGKVSALARPFCLWAILVLCLSAFADPAKRQTKIICREELSFAKRQQLTSKLRVITGWDDLAFDRNGSLQLGTHAAVSGSREARKLLSQAVTGINVLILEDASNRSDVVFSRVVPGRWKENPVQSPPAYVVLIDFADFDHLMGDQRALEAFDVGWGLLHEIDHVVNASLDAETPGQAGNCEDHINQMRRECDLPERSDYFFTRFPHSEDSEFSTKLVRLAFDQKVTAKKHRRYWLIWDAALVGGLDNPNQIAVLR